MGDYLVEELPKKVFEFVLFLLLTAVLGITGVTAWLNGTDTGQSVKATFEVFTQVDVTVLQESPRAFEGLIVLGDALAAEPDLLENLNAWLETQLALP